MHYRFERFELHPASRSLRRDLVELDAPRKVFDCLACLIRHRDRAIGRDELIAAVWKRSNVSDNQLAHTIAAARRLVEDDGTAQRFIRTVPGFGYHWVAPVEVIEAPGDEPAQAGLPPSPDALPALSPDDTPDSLAAYFQALELAYIPEPAPRRTWPLAAAALLVPLVLAALWWHGQQTSAPAAMPAPAQGAHETWVLPAALPDASEAWARVGLMALVAEGMRRQGSDVAPIEKALARIGDAPVHDNLPRLVRELDAVRLIAPSARRAGDAWVVELAAHARDGAQVRVDARDADLLAAGRLAVRRLNLRLGRSGAVLDGSSEEAFELITQAIRGRDFEGALSQLSRLPASERERPEAGLLEIELDLEKGRNGAAREKAERWLERLDPGTHPVQFARLQLANVGAMRQLNLPGWPALVDEAITLLQDADSPRDLALAMHARGAAAFLAGQPAEATRDLIHAHRTLAELGDELAAAKVTATMAQLALLEGRHSEALAQLEQSASVFEDHGAVAPLLATIRTTALLMADMLRWEDVLRITNRLRAVQQATDANSHEQSSYLRMRGWALMQLGRLREAEALLDEQEREIRRELLDNRAEATDNVRLVALSLQRAQLEIAQERWARAADTAFEGFGMFWRLGQHGEIPRLHGYLDNLLLLQIRAQAGPAPWEAWAPLPTLSPEQRDAMNAAASHSGLLARAYWNARHGEVADAERDYRAALASADSARQRFIASSDYIQFLLAQARTEDASRELEHLLVRDPALVDRDYGAALLDLRVRLAQGDDRRWQAAARRVLALAGERRPPAELMPAIEAAQVAVSHP